MPCIAPITSTGCRVNNTTTFCAAVKRLLFSSCCSNGRIYFCTRLLCKIREVEAWLSGAGLAGLLGRGAGPSVPWGSLLCAVRKPFCAVGEWSSPCAVVSRRGWQSPAPCIKILKVPFPMLKLMERAHTTASVAGPVCFNV